MHGLEKNAGCIFSLMLRSVEARNGNRIIEGASTAGYMAGTVPDFRFSLASLPPTLVPLNYLDVPDLA